MKKFLAILFSILFIMGGICSFMGAVTKEAVPDIVRRVVTEKAVATKLANFITNLSYLGLDEEDVKTQISSNEVITDTIDCYTDAVIHAIADSSFSAKKVDISNYLDDSNTEKIIKNVLSNLVDAIINGFDLDVDFSTKLIINTAISIAGSTLSDKITEEINKNIKPSMLTVKTKIETRIYLAFQNFTFKLVMYILTGLSFVLFIVFSKKGKRIIAIGRNLLITGAVASGIMLYTILHTGSKIKKILGYSIPLKLEKWYIYSGAACLAGIVFLIVGILHKKRRAE